jgi:excisionase family DNA binding protein
MLSHVNEQKLAEVSAEQAPSAAVYNRCVGELLMTEAEVAEYLRVTVRTLATWRAEGRGPRPLRVGRGIRYRRSDVDAWLERQAEEPAGDEPE